MNPYMQHRVVIVGDGCAPWRTAWALRQTPVHVTWVQPKPFVLPQFLATSCHDWTMPPPQAHRHRSLQVVHDHVEAVHHDRQQLQLATHNLGYDTLVLAAAARSTDAPAAGIHHAQTAPASQALRTHLHTQWEAARVAGSVRAQHALLDCVIVGGDMAAVTLAGTLAAQARQRKLAADIHVVCPGAHVLPRHPRTSSVHAAAALQRLGVHLHVRAMVLQHRDAALTLHSGGRVHCLHAPTVIDLQHDAVAQMAHHGGQLALQDNLSLSPHDNVFVVGAHTHSDAQVLHQAAYVGRHITAQILGRQKPRPYRPALPSSVGRWWAQAHGWWEQALSHSATRKTPAALLARRACS